MAKLEIETDDLIENPTPRVPVVLCIDTSGSMAGAPILELVDGVNQFYDAINDDDDAPVEIHQDDTFFVCGSGRIKLRAFADGTGELIHYRRDIGRGPKMSFYLRSPTAAPDSLREVLFQAYGQAGRVRKCKGCCLRKVFTRPWRSSWPIRRRIDGAALTTTNRCLRVAPRRALPMNGLARIVAGVGCADETLRQIARP